MDTAISIISNMGFPIFCVLMLGKIVLDMQTKHNEERKLFVEAIQQLNITLTRIMERLGGEDDGK